MITLPQNRNQQILFSAALTIFWAIWILMASFTGPHLDISALYMAGWFWGNGQPELVYLAAPGILDRLDLPEWQRAMANLGSPGQTVTPFIYPPIWAALFSGPAHAMAPITFFKIAYLWHMVAMLLTAWAAYALIPKSAGIAPETWAPAGFVILFATWPVLNAFLTNQPQITVNLLVLLSFLLVSRGQNWRGGALLGLAAAFKVAPILFALIFIANRKWRALVATLVVSGGIALLSLGVMGWPMHAVFLDRLSQLNELIVMTKVNYAPESLLYQAGELLSGNPLPDGRADAVFVAAEPLWITLTIKSAFVLTLAGLYWRTRSLPDAARMPVQLFGLSLATALFGPLSWAHYFVVPSLLLPSLFLIMPAARAWKWIIAIIVVTSLMAFSLLLRFNHHFMMTALMPVLLYIAVLVDTLRASGAMSRPTAFQDPI